MRYQARGPAGPLLPYVKCLWRLRGLAAEIEPQPIVPDGGFELIVHLGDPFVELGVYAARQDRRLLAATLTRAVVVAPGGAVDVLGVRFVPGGAYPFLSAAPYEVVDTVAPARDVIASDVSAVLDRIEPAPTEDLFRAVEAAMLRRLDRAGRDPAFDRLVADLVAPGGASIASLAAAAGTSLRQLERRFKRRAGVSAKVLQRVVRFHRVATQLLDGSPDLAGMALDAGFYDQAHMTNEFRALAATTPARYPSHAGALDRLFAER